MYCHQGGWQRQPSSEKLVLWFTVCGQIGVCPSPLFHLGFAPLPLRICATGLVVSTPPSMFVHTNAQWVVSCPVLKAAVMETMAPTVSTALLQAYILISVEPWTLIFKSIYLLPHDCCDNILKEQSIVKDIPSYSTNRNWWHIHYFIHFKVPSILMLHLVIFICPIYLFYIFFSCD